MIERKVNAMHKYEEFLEKVKTQYSDEFSEMTDILNRYETLKKTNKTLVDENQKLQEELDKLTNDAAAYEKDKTNEILGMNNSIAELQKTLERAEDEKNRLQRSVEEGVKDSRIESKQLSQLLMAICNLYWKCKDRRNKLKLKWDGEGKETDPFPPTSAAIKKAENQLDMIGQFILHYNTIIKNASDLDKGHGGDMHGGPTKKTISQTKTTHY